MAASGSNGTQSRSWILWELLITLLLLVCVVKTITLLMEAKNDVTTDEPTSLAAELQLASVQSVDV